MYCALLISLLIVHFTLWVAVSFCLNFCAQLKMYKSRRHTLTLQSSGSDFQKCCFWASCCRGQLKCVGDGTRAETTFSLSAKRTSPFKSAGGRQFSRLLAAEVFSGSIAGYTMFRGSVKGTGYPLHSPVSPSLPLPCVIVCHHISTEVLYLGRFIVGVLMPYTAV